MAADAGTVPHVTSQGRLLVHEREFCPNAMQVPEAYKKSGQRRKRSGSVPSPDKLARKKTLRRTAAAAGTNTSFEHLIETKASAIG